MAAGKKKVTVEQMRGSDGAGWCYWVVLVINDVTPRLSTFISEAELKDLIETGVEVIVKPKSR